MSKARDLDFPIAKLHELFSCVDGVLIRRSRPRSDFTSDRAHAMWNGRWADKAAGQLHKVTGYRYVSVTDDGTRRSFFEHRVVFAITNGRWPDDEIDHRNRIKGDNRPENLREATHAQNSQTRAGHSRNKSGHTGVFWLARINKYQVSIGISGRQRYVGVFAKLEDAIAARNKARDEAHPFWREETGKEEKGI